MSFVEPLFLAGLLAAAIPIVVHLINRRKAVQQPFPALRLLKESNKKEARSIKVRQWLLMALRVLAIALLAFALAKPFVLSDRESGAGADRLPSAVVFVVDDTMSMNNGDWWERAGEEFSGRLDDLKPWDEVALITAADHDGPVERLTNDHRTVREAFDELEPTQTTAPLPSAFETAEDILAASKLPNKRIVTVGDFTQGGFPTSASADAAVEYPIEQVSVRDADETPMNLAVEDVSFKQVGAAREGKWSITATLHNYGERDAEGVEVRLGIDGEEVTGGLVDVPAGESKPYTIRHQIEESGVRHGVIELVDADALPDDNRRYFNFQMKSDVDVLVVNGAPSSVPYNDETFFLVRALNPGQETESNIIPTVVTGENFGGKELSKYDVVILSNVAQVGAASATKLQEFVEGGGGLFISMGNQVETEAYNQNLEPLLPKRLRNVKLLAERDDPDAPVKITRFGSMRRSHPVFRAFESRGGTSLKTVSVFKYMLLEPSPPEQSEVLLSYKDNAPALLERRVGKGRVFMLTTTVDRAWTDLPVRTAFLPLARRSMLYLARRATSKGRDKHHVGQQVELDVKGLIDERAIVRGPNDARHVLEPTEGMVTFTPRHAGLYEVWADSDEASGASGDDGGHKLGGLTFSVNVDTTESDLKPLSEDALSPWMRPDGEGEGDTSDRVAEAGAADQRQVNLWPGILFGVTLALLLETLVGTRRSVLKKLWRKLTFQKDPEVEV